MRILEDLRQMREDPKLCDKKADKWLHDGGTRGILLIYASPTGLQLCRAAAVAADPQETFFLRQQRSGTLIQKHSAMLVCAVAGAGSLTHIFLVHTNTVRTTTPSPPCCFSHPQRWWHRVVSRS